MLRALVKGFPSPSRLALPRTSTFFTLPRTFFTTTPTMSSDLLSRLEALSISVPASAVVQHGPVSGSKAWKEALEGKEGVPEKYELTKTLVFKPKTAKTATPVPIVVIAGESTETPSGALQKELDVKEMRLASEDLIKEFFNCGKDDVTPMTLTSDLLPRISTVLDSSLSSSSSLYAVHPSTSDSTIFLSGTDLAKFLISLAHKDNSNAIKLVDFAALKSATPAGAAKPEKKVAKDPSKTAMLDKKRKEEAKIEGAAEVAIGIRKDGDFPEWYKRVLVKGEMIDYYDISGCYILRPQSYAIWESIQAWFDKEIKKLGIQNAYFPMFVSNSRLEKEKDHIEGFAPEVAWVTRAGQSDLEEPIAIRPTSETVMYPYYAKWIQSHRDLPLRLNQWNSVVRWEFKNPQPFLRTREFLWQEGHTAFQTREESEEEVYQILDLYRRVYEELLAVPMVPGVKSVNERFAGGLFTATVEGFVPTSGRGIQAATSHCLGQNFSKMFDIEVEDPAKPGSSLHVWQNSWGLSTRSIGVMVMTHGDDKGLITPPRVASTQVVVIPAGMTVKTSPEQRAAVYEAVGKLVKELQKVDVRVKSDMREGYTPGFKWAHWEMMGVPLRLEIGPKDLEKGQTLSVRRDNSQKSDLSLADITSSVPALLETIQADMFAKAKAEFDSRRVVVENWDDIVPTLDKKCVAVLPWCEGSACEDDIKKRTAEIAAAKSGEEDDDRSPSSGAKSLCIPLNQEQFPSIDGKTCPACKSAAKRWTMFGRSY